LNKIILFCMFATISFTAGALESKQESELLLKNAISIMPVDLPTATAFLSDVSEFNIIIERHAATGRFIIVNIKEQHIRVYDNHNLVIYEKVIVGKGSTPTPLFSETITGIVLSPPWNLPKRIARNYFPRMKKAGGWSGYRFYKDGVNVSINDVTADDNYRIIQPHSANSALGDFKFNTKNNTYSVFVHDTPDKHLFAQTNRIFSAGCIRMQNPIKLAEFLLDKNEFEINKILKQNKTKHLRIKKKIPIYIVSWARWFTPAGLFVNNE